jgi:Concanavalin A-like lectin/glucanases superfamily/Divergent InlB B-repeat domain/Immunoglobulin I-set domain/Putative Ig domain
MLKYSYDLNGNLAKQELRGILAPKITYQPVKLVVNPGRVATFSVVLEDANGLTFQWQLNGTDIPGATGDSLVLPNVKIANEGQYTVVITNSVGSVTSTPAALLLDSDGDGLPDSWEIANFGNTTAQRGEGDADLDRQTNLEEFLDNTNPTSVTSQKVKLVAYSDAGGSVTVSPMKLSYELGETVTLTAEPFALNTFKGWSGDINTGDLAAPNPIVITLNSDKTIRAKFAKVAPIPPGLIAFWRGETDASDLVGGHNGTFFAGTTAITPRVARFGKVGGAFTFDGKVHIQVPDSPTLKPAQVTLAAWVFPMVQSGDYQTVVARGFSTNGEDTWYLGLSGGGFPQFWTFPTSQLGGPFAIPINQWTFLAATFDGTTKRLYVNGVEVVSKTGIPALVYDPAPVPVTIGADWESNVPFALFNGSIDEVTIYDRALTFNEITDVYNADHLGLNIRQLYFTSSVKLPTGAVGIAYTHQITTIFGTAPISFSLLAGVLPSGIMLSSLGILSGTPAPGTSGIADFTLLAIDSAGVSIEKRFMLEVF